MEDEKQTELFFPYEENVYIKHTLYLGETGDIWSSWRLDPPYVALLFIQKYPVTGSM